MKKYISLTALVLICAILLVGCGGVELATFQGIEEVGNGVYVVLAEKTDKNFEWYCTVDLLTSSILSVNLIYPESYGEPTETFCEEDGKKISCKLQIGEQEGKRVAFFTLSASDSLIENENEILIPQKFGRKKVRFKFIPKMIAEALENA